jgi:hypothetical protein
MSPTAQRPRSRSAATVDDVLAKVQRGLESIWADRGFGEISIVSERNDRDGFRVFVRVTTSERMVVRDGGPRG